MKLSIHKMRLFPCEHFGLSLSRSWLCTLSLRSWKVSQLTLVHISYFALEVILKDINLTFEIMRCYINLRNRQVFSFKSFHEGCVTSDEIIDPPPWFPLTKQNITTHKITVLEHTSILPTWYRLSIYFQLGSGEQWMCSSSGMLNKHSISTAAMHLGVI